MPQSLLPINPKTILTVTAATATATSSAIKLDLADSYTLLINCTAVLNTSPTLDIVMQVSYDLGTTYVNAPIRSAQITAVASQWITFRNRLGDGEAPYNQTTVADTGGALTKDFSFDPRFVKFKYTIGGSGAGGETFTITQFAKASLGE